MKLAVALKRAQRGELADFRLFDLVTTAWLSKNRRHRLPPPGQDEGADQVASELQAEAAHATHQLGKRLAEAVRNDDAPVFRKVAATIEQLRAKPRAREQFEPHHREEFTVLSYFRQHKSATIAELLAWFTNEQGLRIEEKTLRRMCKRLVLPITLGKVGRPLK